MTESGKTSCCSPTTDDKPPLAISKMKTVCASELFTTIIIPEGNALIGTNHEQILYDGEAPLRTEKLRGFRIGQTTVTNAQFAAFVDDTGYVTEAERWGWSFVFYHQVPDRLQPTQAIVGFGWWRRVDGANWRDINGPDTAAEAWHPDHPVVQVSYKDACAFANWAGGRLPTEAEWEHAARGGLGDVKYPWGDEEPSDLGPYYCNNWQGKFPIINSEADGHAATAPAQSFDPNGYGLYNMVGNVWEWTRTPFTIKSQTRAVKERLRGLRGYMVGKGGSFLCHKSYCYRYRIASRSPQDKTSTTPHQGFRLVWDIPK